MSKNGILWGHADMVFVRWGQLPLMKKRKNLNHMDLTFQNCRHKHPSKHVGNDEDSEFVDETGNIHTDICMNKYRLLTLNVRIVTSLSYAAHAWAFSSSLRSSSVFFSSSESCSWYLYAIDGYVCSKYARTSSFGSFGVGRSTRSGLVNLSYEHCNFSYSLLNIYFI